MGANERDLTRRAFIGIGAAAVMTGATLAGCSQNEEPPTSGGVPAGTGEPTGGTAASTAGWRIPPAAIADSEITETYETEIGIVGLGHAGLAICRAAAEKGAKVVVVEMQPRDTWWTFGHDVGHINSKFLKGRGVPEVDPVDFYNNFMIQAHAKPNPHIVMEYTKNCGDAVDWYLEAMDQSVSDMAHVIYWPDNQYTVKNLSNGYHYYTGTAQWWESNWTREVGSDMSQDPGVEMKELSVMQLEYVESNFSDSVTIMFETKGAQLVQESDGTISGFIAQGPDGYIKIKASKGVVLAGGGFGGNPEMCNDLIPHVVNMCAPGESIGAMMDRDGSSIQMGYWVGGRIEGEPSSMNFDTASGPNNFSGLWLDEDCKRFQDEAFAGPEINGMFMARSKRGNVTALYDSNYELNLLTGHPGHGCFDYSDEIAVKTQTARFEAARAAGAEGADDYYCADTLEGLADMLGYDPAHKQQFLKSVEDYNAICAAGKDTDFGKDPHYLFSITQAPFYAHVGALSIGFGLVTTGAFVTTNDYEIVDENYKPIKNLYASGNTCGLRFGSAYITPIPGMSLGFCITLGRVLGEKLAAK